MLEKEAEHLTRCIGPLRIGVRARRTPARPSMPGTAYDPLLEDHMAPGIAVEGAFIGAAAGRLTVLNRHSQIRGRRFPQLRDHLVAIVRVHRAVLIAMEHNGWHSA